MAGDKKMLRAHLVVGSGENAASPVVRAGNHPGLLPVSASFSPGFLRSFGSYQSLRRLPPLSEDCI